MMDIFGIHCFKSINVSIDDDNNNNYLNSGETLSRGAEETKVKAAASSTSSKRFPLQLVFIDLTISIIVLSSWELDMNKGFGTKNYLIN